MKQQSPNTKNNSSRSAAHHAGAQAQSLPAAGLSLQFATDPEKKKPGQAKMNTSQLAIDPEKEKMGQAKMNTSQLAIDPEKEKMGQAKMNTVQRKSDEVINKMGDAMGADFSDVKIHEGSKASDVGALAYTQGNDIHFAQGKFDTASQSGKALLGHELAHVVQQREGRVQPTTSINGLPVNDSPSLENEADSIGNKVASQI